MEEMIQKHLKVCSTQQKTDQIDQSEGILFSCGGRAFNKNISFPYVIFLRQLVLAFGCDDKHSMSVLLSGSDNFFAWRRYLDRRCRIFAVFAESDTKYEKQFSLDKSSSKIDQVLHVALFTGYPAGDKFF
jgi:hypothetical protein